MTVAVRAIVAAVGCAALACGGSALTVTRTSVSPDSCTMPSSAVLAEFASQSLGVQQCPGAGGWIVLFVSSDERSWLELRRDGRRWSAEDDIVYRSPIGLFPGIDEAFPLEWRGSRRTGAEAVIARVTAQASDDPTARVEAFYVIGLRGPSPCVLGRETTLATARTLADGERRCPAQSAG